VDFVDIDSRTYNLCPDVLEAKLASAEKSGTLPKVVIPVHFAGQSCDMKRISGLASKYGFRVIEDASHAIGGRYLDVPIGSCQYSDITVFSFHPVKIVTTAEGGAALTNNPELASKMLRLRSHGITPDKSLFHNRPDDEVWNYQQIDLGFNYRMTELQAALGLSQISRLSEYVEKRHQISNRYNDELAGLPIVLPCQARGTYSSYHLYSIQLVAEDGAPSQKLAFAKLHGANIMANLHYIPVYLQPYYANLGFGTGYCPNAEQYYRRAISLPMYPTMSADAINHVVTTMRGLAA
jgi:dTDP-4-amino-4,6-dideoxygalactose transaminase